MNKVNLIIVLFLSLCTGQGTSIDPCPADENGCQSPNYPNNYDKGSCFCQRNVGPGYQLELTVEHLDLNGDGKDNLIIKTEPNEEKEIVLIRSLKKERNFLLPESAYIIFNSNSINKNTGFRIRFERRGQTTTTTEPPTTAIEWPKPSANDSIYYTVYLANITAKDFAIKVNDFRYFMANITEEYCALYQIPLAKNVTLDNIIIDLATQCSVLWPDYENCVTVRYGIPVFIKPNSSWTGYQLNSTHLEAMWLKLAKDKLNILDYTIFEEPDNNYFLLIWILISLVVVGVFFVMLLGFRTFSFKYGNRKRRRSDTEQIIPASKRVSDASLWPISEQVVPPLFDNGHNIYYEPDMNASSRVGMQNTTSQMMAIDDMSDEDIMDVTTVSPKSGSAKQFITLPDNMTAKESAL